ncbi:hypothetical protein DL96DRAFT_1581353 [Flagelloscypha sp. PMI_526]|nr:hypothetical protein DL96DRAFT_1581353 [Flagelloscypha sp. PMI_526]
MGPKTSPSSSSFTSPTTLALLAEPPPLPPVPDPAEVKLFILILLKSKTGLNLGLSPVNLESSCREGVCVDDLLLGVPAPTPFLGVLSGTWSMMGVVAREEPGEDEEEGGGGVDILARFGVGFVVLSSSDSVSGRGRRSADGGGGSGILWVDPGMEGVDDGVLALEDPVVRDGGTADAP